MTCCAARVGDATGHRGSIVGGSAKVTINGCPAAGLGASATVCAFHGGAAIASGSGSVFVNKCNAARIGDVTGCGAPIASGSGNVIVGG